MQIQSYGGEESFNKQYEEWQNKPWNIGLGEPCRKEYAWYYARVWELGIDEAYKEMLNDDTIEVNISKDEFIKQTSNYYTCVFDWDKRK